MHQKVNSIKQIEIRQFEVWHKKLNVHNYLSILFCDFPLIARSGKSHVTISLIGCAPRS